MSVDFPGHPDDWTDEQWRAYKNIRDFKDNPLSVAQDVLRGYGHDAIADALQGYQKPAETPQEPQEAQYAWPISAQQWDDDPYYVASSWPVHKVVVVASNQKDAIAEALRLLGESKRGRHWRTWTGKAKDLRLLTEAEKAEL
jgi:hypothetical protein